MYTGHYSKICRRNTRTDLIFQTSIRPKTGRVRTLEADGTAAAEAASDTLQHGPHIRAHGYRRLGEGEAHLHGLALLQIIFRPPLEETL